jgi:hypothetical protein
VDDISPIIEYPFPEPEYKEFKISDGGSLSIMNTPQWRIKFSNQMEFQMDERPTLWMRIGMFIWFGVRAERINNE